MAYAKAWRWEGSSRWVHVVLVRDGLVGSGMEGDGVKKVGSGLVCHAKKPGLGCRS